MSSLDCAAHSAVVLKAENMAEWFNKLRNIISSKGGKVKGESGLSMRQSLSDGSLVRNLMNFLSSKVLVTGVFCYDYCSS